jgi:DNA-binding response OmpR family regulator
MLAGKPLLLVEDDALIAQTLEDALSEAGFAIQVAIDGAAGLSALEDSREGFSALLTDIRLPHSGPDGFDLAHRARELSPTIAIVYMSGDSAIEWAAKGVPKSIMLQKPFAIAQLVTAVSNLLNESSQI